MNVKTLEDYKRLSEEQAKALNILAKNCKEKAKTIEYLNREIAHLKKVISDNKY